MYMYLPTSEIGDLAPEKKRMKNAIIRALSGQFICLNCLFLY